MLLIDQKLYETLCRIIAVQLAVSVCHSETIHLNN